MSTVLMIEKVTRDYGPIRALDSVSLSLQAGACTGILGPNGAGKTTLMRVCAGWLGATMGTITICGKEQSAVNLSCRGSLGIVSLDAPPLPELPVRAMVELAGTWQGLIGGPLRAACDETIVEFRLQEHVRRRCGVLSTGLRQRVMLACAMLHRPTLLLLDEPTTGLDPDMRHIIWNHLLALRARGVAMLLATHAMDEAATLCHTVCMLNRGRVVSTMAPDGVDAVAQLDAQFRAMVNSTTTGAAP